MLFGVPAGAVGAITVQRTLHYGVGAGLLTGLGSSAADCFYACAGAFGLTLISDFLLKIQNVIHSVGGCLILAMGIGMLTKKENGEQSAADVSGRIKMFLSTFAIGITNPAAILTFLFAFSWFGISGNTSLWEGTCLVIGVFIGTYFWWGLLTIGTHCVKNKAKSINLMKINKVFGVLLILFGIAVIISLFR